MTIHSDTTSKAAEDRFRGCLTGLAAGDAVGTTVEFSARGSFEPVTDMVGGGPFHLEPGEWTDDTSMALCLAVSLIERGGFDARDQMERYCRWQDEGYLASNGRCFDIGTTISRALARFRATGEPLCGSTDPMSAGNGCLMRLAPVPMFFHPDLSATIHHSRESSRTTHQAAECLEASGLFAAMLHAALAGKAKEDILRGAYPRAAPPLGSKLLAIAEGAYRDKPVAEIRGSGYVVDALEAALWCFCRTDSFREAILCAVNLGDDADTTAAICGQVAGAFYGFSGIPREWVDRLALGGLIDSSSRKLAGVRDSMPGA